jgi:hypothetical protein
MVEGSGRAVTSGPVPRQRFAHVLDDLARLRVRDVLHVAVRLAFVRALHFMPAAGAAVPAEPIFEPQARLAALRALRRFVGRRVLQAVRSHIAAASVWAGRPRVVGQVVGQAEWFAGGFPALLADDGLCFHLHAVGRLARRVIYCRFVVHVLPFVVGYGPHRCPRWRPITLYRWRRWRPRPLCPRGVTRFGTHGDAGAVAGAQPQRHVRVKPRYPPDSATSAGCYPRCYPWQRRLRCRSQLWPLTCVCMVGEGGFEPPTSCTQSRCASAAPLPGPVREPTERRLRDWCRRQG